MDSIFLEDDAIGHVNNINHLNDINNIGVINNTDNINNNNDVVENFNFKDQLKHLKNMKTCSTRYNSMPSSNIEMLYDQELMENQNILFLNDTENDIFNFSREINKEEYYKKYYIDKENHEKKDYNHIYHNFENNHNFEYFKNSEHCEKSPEQIIANNRYYENLPEQVIINNKDMLKNDEEKQNVDVHVHIDMSKVMYDIYFLCFHKNGCEYIIRKLKEDNKEEKEIILNSLLIDTMSLCPDIYGSYVAQSIFDLKDEKYKERFTDEFLKHTSFLTLHTYGCRLIQKSLESLSDEYKCKIFKELQEDLIKYICHQNGNHVIQKCVEVLPCSYIDIIINIIEEYLPFLSSHAYGCRIVQRIYEIGNEQQINRLNEQIIKKIHLIKNRYGNYVIQKCFEHSDDNIRFIITDEIVNDIYKLSSHKYACNIIEKILLKKEYKYKKKIIKKIVSDISDGKDNIINICKDCYGNFMMQKLLTTCRKKERNFIIKTIIENLDKLKDETYGKYILRAINNLEK
ncbi:mRNA-binding protein PUF2 [Plasmodium sp. gorilla clade G2]|uniref:mRNA-binding protein PUF2 n=1 Tax=Plasmodium sp. gorilla clade G2 TaxID=880535 RepID=UPI000D229848|nr:mRNA-binding protein PUF2 [Plasmodium sp. gorilla clade G2]SOV11461.1 mRNA-binding protein PUF2 [Plasmodium sp. gorilla clade G2]